LNAQAPGSPALPQPWQAAGNSVSPDAEPEMVAKADSFLRNSVLRQTGHSGAGVELRTRISKSFPQEAH
jgi:hypothetical protein